VRRVADALRSLMARFVATEAPVEEFEGVADTIESLAARLAAYPQASLYLGFAEAANAYGDSEGPFDNSPVMGLSNPLAPPMRLEVLDDAVVGTAVLGSAYEGPPGYVHGGFVAAMFDELLGLTQTLSGKPGMTGKLNVTYRSPTPLHTELRFRGTVHSANGRKIVCHGTIHAGDTLCAQAEGLFIHIDPERFIAMRDARDAALRAPEASDEGVA
jgi:acyl-coenzyme A thioesterase PaaI-like protein